MAGEYKNVRSYEVSIWTLQDRFLSVLKWATMDCKGLILEPEVVLRDDGTLEFSFTIPKFYYDGATRITNPMWLHLENLPLEANMHKLKVVFNKNTTDEKVLEFLVTSVIHEHSLDSVNLNVKAEGLAFHELGKLGYKISLSETNYTNALDEWELNGLLTPLPVNNILFWNDLVFKDTKGNWRTNWTYELLMDWSSFSSFYEAGRVEQNDQVTQIIPKRSDVLYEDEYVSSWELGNDGKMKSRYIQSTREKYRIIDVSESNIYNITLTIAEQFGVFCRYEYEHDENYLIVGRKVIYYNNYILDLNGHIDLTYPYSSAAITRTVDNSNIVTKMFVTGVDYNSDTVTIMDVDANKTKEDYLLNFDYLHDILGITDEQYAAVSEFEATMHTLNNRLIEILERIRVISNLLVEAEANATTYKNALALDLERWEEAGRLRTELTGGTNYIDLDGKPCIVKYRDDCGFYITISWDGVDPSSLKIYLTNNYSGSKTAYSDLITSYRLTYNEFNNLIRIDNITSNKTIEEGNTLWLLGRYNPTLAYDNILKVWAQRKAIDEAEAKKAEEKVIDYNWYLHGIRVGYARTDECRLGTANWPPAVASMIPSPIDIEDPMKSDRVGLCRAARNQEDITILNPFADLDNLNTSPDLLFYEKNYLERKLEEISKFERMMGPALREGYWQPDNYHDYGDLFKDNFTISYNDNNISLPQTNHVSFIWDGDKYYDSETPLIYTANAAGDVEQHLTVDISDCLEEVAAHLEDLSFVYCNPSNIATIIELLNKHNEANTTIQNFIGDSPETIASEFFTAIENLQVNFTNLLLSDYRSNEGGSYDYSNAKYWRIPPETAVSDFSVVPLLTIIETIITAANNAKTNLTMDNIYADTSVTQWENINQQLQFGITKINELIGIIRKELSTKQTNSVEYNLFNRVITTLNSFLDDIKNLSDSLSSDESTGLIDALNEYNFTASLTEALENTKYSSYRIGSECELGWVSLKDNASERIPVLIITGAKTLDEDTFNFITTSYYKINGVDADNVSITETWVKAEGASSFIGYPNLDESGNIIFNSWNCIKVLDDINDFIGLRVENEYHAIRQVEKADYDENGVLRAPTPQEYSLIRQYPRLYFDTLKLKEDLLKIFRGAKQLENYVDYYVLEDDRSKGLQVLGIGYYATIKPELIYSSGKTSIPFSLIYILSNIDVAIYLDALNVMYENSHPKVSYEVELSVLNPEFIHTAYNRLNQIVHINDNDLLLENVSGYISTITMKLDKFWEDTVEIKNYETKFEDLFSTIVAQTEAMKSTRAGLNTAISAFTSTGLIDSNIIYNSINNANLNLSFGKGTLTIDLNEGIWGTSDTGVVAFRGGGIFTATEKDNGGNWIWNTGILPSGINANLITTGQLDTNKIKVYAGDELRFLWNGEGLYAYKSFNSESAEIVSKIAIPDNKIDLKQYVKFNSDGLFLVSEAGTYYLAPVATQSDGSIIYGYNKLLTTVKRVEISWQGLKLRNWDNEEVFYADPDTGNLTLKGSIIAKSGTIGGWIITEEMLSGNGVNLIGGTNGNEDNAGIYLTTGVNAGESIIINGERCYHYKYKDDNNIEQDCYCPLFNIAMTTRVLTGEEKIYALQYAVISATPKYLDIVQETVLTSSNPTVEDGNGDNNFTSVSEGSVENITTRMYIVRAQGSTIHIKNNNNLDIEYDGTTSPDAQWYNDIKTVDSQNYVAYIDENKAMAYVQIQLPVGTLIEAVTDFKTTFSARANDGSVFIRKGLIGNYVINTTDSGTISILSNSLLDLNNYFIVDDQQIELGLVFYNITANSNSGTFSLYRLNGETENFNVAAMKAYKDAVAAAGKVTLLLTYSNNLVTAIATSGVGATTQLSLTFSEMGVTIDNNTSGCSGCTSLCSLACNSNCVKGCQNGCYNTCKNGCYNTCTGGCSSTCTEVCKNSCTESCATGCTTGCTGGCMLGCRGGCKSSCESSCVGTCTGACANSCRTGCYLTAMSGSISPD